MNHARFETIGTTPPTTANWYINNKIFLFKNETASWLGWPLECDLRLHSGYPVAPKSLKNQPLSAHFSPNPTLTAIILLIIYYNSLLVLSHLI